MEVYNVVSYEYLSDCFVDYLDEIYGEQEAFGEKVFASDFRNYSRLTFRCMLSDWIDEAWHEVDGGYVAQDDWDMIQNEKDYLSDKIDQLYNAETLLTDNDCDDLSELVLNRIQKFEKELEELNDI